MIEWASTPRLLLDDDGRAWLVALDADGGYAGLRPLGRADRVDPAALDPAAREDLAELLDRWRSAGSREDLEAEWDAAYYGSR